MEGGEHPGRERQGRGEDAAAGGGGGREGRSARDQGGAVAQEARARRALLAAALFFPLLPQSTRTASPSSLCFTRVFPSPSDP